MRLLSDVQLTLRSEYNYNAMRTCHLRELMCELPFHCLARSWHLEVLMVISIDSLLIKQLRNLLNVILVISIITWQDGSLFEFYSGEYVNSDRYHNISLSLKNVMFVVWIVQLVLGGVSVETSRNVEFAFWLENGWKPWRYWNMKDCLERLNVMNDWNVWNIWNALGKSCGWNAFERSWSVLEELFVFLHIELDSGRFLYGYPVVCRINRITWILILFEELYLYMTWKSVIGS